MARTESRKHRASRGKRHRNAKHDRRVFTWSREATRENQMRYRLLVRALTHPDAEPVAFELLVTRHPFEPVKIAQALRKIHKIAQGMIREIRANKD